MRSRWVAVAELPGTGRKAFRPPQPMLAAAARTPVTHFESALGSAPPTLLHGTPLWELLTSTHKIRAKAIPQ